MGPVPMPENLAISGGDAGPSATGDQSAGRYNTWNFAPPDYQVKAQQNQIFGMQLQTVAFVAGAVGLAWLVLRK